MSNHKTQLYSGRVFDAADPTNCEFTKEDIAHGLSMICRYGGAVKSFYSVAEHSVAMASVAYYRHGDVQAALCCLFHDAAEAILGTDMKSPIKALFPAWRALEHNVDGEIRRQFHKYGVPLVQTQLCKKLDEHIVLNEREEFLKPYMGEWSHPNDEPLPVALYGWTPFEAECAWLRTFDELVVAHAKHAPIIGGAQ